MTLSSSPPTATTGSHAYQLMEICAAGTFGTVCVVRDLDRGTLVALKVLKEAHLHRPRVIARTHDEASMLSCIRHPGIVDVEGLIRLEGRPVVVMEWVRGLSLEAVLRNKRDGLPAAESIEIVRQATLALGAAYHWVPVGGGSPMHIIHRDVKPSNMLMSVDGDVKMVDFGIARGEFEGKEAKTLSMVLGARGYLAPERLDGYDDKPSCDIYSLGIVLYELLTGRHIVLSVHRDYHAEALHKHLGHLKLPGLAPAALDHLRRIIAAMCAYDEAARPDHARVVRELDALLRDHGLRPDVNAWARQELLPMFRNRSRVRPIDHPAYPELAFVERMARMVRFPAPPDVDQEVRFFLRRPDWHHHVAELELILVKNPHWSEAPFLELLPSGPRAWWQFWGGSELPTEQIVSVLKVLRDRPTPAVRERALHLRRHGDPRIVEVADELLGG
ncbi:MAG: serine/threonine-protein kinase [Myxococcota bacterium]